MSSLRREISLWLGTVKHEYVSKISHFENRSSIFEQQYESMHEYEAMHAQNFWRNPETVLVHEVPHSEGVAKSPGAMSGDLRASAERFGKSR